MLERHSAREVTPSPWEPRAPIHIFQNAITISATMHASYWRGREKWWLDAKATPTIRCLFFCHWKFCRRKGKANLGEQSGALARRERRGGLRPAALRIAHGANTCRFSQFCCHVINLLRTEGTIKMRLHLAGTAHRWVRSRNWDISGRSALSAISSGAFDCHRHGILLLAKQD